MIVTYWLNLNNLITYHSICGINNQTQTPSFIFSKPCVDPATHASLSHAAIQLTVLPFPKGASLHFLFTCCPAILINIFIE